MNYSDINNKSLCYLLLPEKNPMRMMKKPDEEEEILMNRNLLDQNLRKKNHRYKKRKTCVL